MNSKTKATLVLTWLTASFYGSFTLSQADTDTETENECTEPNENIVYSIVTWTQSYTSHFLSVAVSVSMAGSVNTP